MIKKQFNNYWVIVKSIKYKKYLKNKKYVEIILKLQKTFLYIF